MRQPETEDSSSSIDQPPASTTTHSPHLSDSNNRSLRVGYALNPKKTRLFDARGLFTPPTSTPPPNTPHPTFTPLDFTRPLDEQGPFDVLLLKLTDSMARALYGADEEAAQLVERAEKYGRESGCMMIDDLQLVRRVLDRRRISEVLTAANLTVANYPVRAPPAIHLQLPTTEPVALPFPFPVICKPVQSCGSASSHTFYILYSVEQLCNLSCVSGSYVVQQLLPHSGTMYKVYVINGESFVIPKPSLPPHITTPPPPTHPHHPPPHPLTLDSQSMSLTPLTTATVPLAAEAAIVEAGASVSGGMVGVLAGVAVELSGVFGLTLYGFDVVESGGVLYVVDVNYFPSYNRVDGLSDKLAAAIQDKYGREMAARQRLVSEQQKAVEVRGAATNGNSAR